MENEAWRQVMSALERQGRENAERDAALRADFDRLLVEIAERDRAKAERDAALRADFDRLRVENAERDRAKAERDRERDVASAERDAALRADFGRLRVENEEARAKLSSEIADLRTKIAYGFVAAVLAVVAILRGLDFIQP